MSQSALTDFLASHNISANQIRQDANARRAAVLAQPNTEDTSSNEADDFPPPKESDEETIPRRKNETKLQVKKRKKTTEKAIAKIKASKKFQRRRKLTGSDEELVEEEDARALFDESLAPLPAQMENCEICTKRFTVTPYTRTGPQGSLVCPKCARDLDKDEDATRKKRKVAAGRQRRKIQSDLLDGIYPGAKSLMNLCVETLVNNVHMADSFGDLPDALMDRLSEIICKKRLLKPETLKLFLQAGRNSLKITDGAYLASDDFIRIFQVMPSIKSLRLRNSVQFKNKVMDHLLGTQVALEHLSLHGVNLIEDDLWNKFIIQKTAMLKSLKLYWTDGYFGDEQIQLLSQSCPGLQRLKLVHNQKITDNGIEHVANFSELEQLALEIYKHPGQEHLTTPPLLKVINAIGATLRRLSLVQFHYIDDRILEAIHTNCKQLTKLRITYNQKITNASFAKLFTNWSNPPLTYIDLNNCTHVDASEPRENPDGIGLSSEGFTAMMAHSSKTLRHLNVHACRHISSEAFEAAFSDNMIYPELRKMNLSFCQEVNNFIIGRIFKVCPTLKELIIFGNFKVNDVRVPKGRILIGMPNALGMQVEGADDEEEGCNAW